MPSLVPHGRPSRGDDKVDLWEDGGAERFGAMVGVWYVQYHTPRGMVEYMMGFGFGICNTHRGMWYGIIWGGWDRMRIRIMDTAGIRYEN